MQRVEQVGNVRIKIEEDLPAAEANLLGDRVFNLEVLDLEASDLPTGHFVYQSVTEARAIRARPPEPIEPVPRPVPVQSVTVYHLPKRVPPSARYQALVAEHRGRERGQSEEAEYVSPRFFDSIFDK